MSRPPDSNGPAYTRENHPGRRQSDKAQFCPKCHNAVEPGHMDSHMYSAHGVDRRQTEENKTPPPPERKQSTKTAPKDDGGEGQQQRKKSRWFDRPE